MPNKANQLVLKLDPVEIAELGEKSKKLIFKPEFEEQLAKLLNFQKLIDSTVKEVERHIQMAGDQLMPNFTGITGTKVKCTNRVFGSIYKITDKANVDPMFIKEIVSRRINPDTSAIDLYRETMGQLPEGVEENARIKNLKVEITEK
jgi:hypothetical protein